MPEKKQYVADLYNRQSWSSDFFLGVRGIFTWFGLGLKIFDPAQSKICNNKIITEKNTTAVLFHFVSDTTTY